MNNPMMDPVMPSPPEDDMMTDIIPDEEPTGNPFDTPTHVLSPINEHPEDMMPDDQMMNVEEAPAPTNQPIEPVEDFKEDLDGLIRTILREDESNRAADLKVCRRNNLYWDGKDIIWDSSSSAYIEISDVEQSNEVTDKVIQIYKTYGLAIVAALSTGVPKQKYYPEDADNADDIIASKSFTKISERVDSHNDAQSLITRMLVTKWNEHYIAAYTYYEKRDEFGKEKIEVKESQTVPDMWTGCPECGADIPNGAPPNTLCESCGNTVAPFEVQTGEHQEDVVVDTQEVPKGRQIIEIYGTSDVSIPRYAKRLQDCHYLRLEDEIHYSKAREIYPGVEIVPGNIREEEGRNARLSSIFYDELDRKVVTRSRVWLRPFAFNVADEEKRQSLKSEYPSGTKVTLINDVIVDVVEEGMDEHWRLGVDPIAKTLTAVPYGDCIIDIQDSYNDVFAITMRTLLFGVPELFADPTTLSKQAYKDKHVTPGAITFAKSKSGMPLASSFFATRSTTLPKETPEVAAKILDLGQLLSRAYPSIYGGPSAGNTKTAAEYEQSRQAALQGLAPLWRIINSLWAEIKDVATRSYRKNLSKDEHFVTTDGAKGFVNNWIRLSELQGNIGDVVPESSEQFPTTWAQKKSIILELLNSKNPEILAILGNPNNIEMVAEFIGLPEIYIPGEDDRIVQLKEIMQMVSAQPDPMNPQGQVAPMIQPSPSDNNEIHAAIAKAWLNSSYGQEVKAEKPDVFNAVMQHMQMHEQIIQQQQMAQQQAQMAAQAQMNPPTNNEGARQ
jgi:hypothetical protein